MDSVKDGGASEDPVGALRAIPSLDAFLRRSELAPWPRTLVAREARRFLDEVREEALAGRLSERSVAVLCATPAAEKRVAERCEARVSARHRRVINATGIVLHTGIGRAPLAEAAKKALLEVAGYGIVEVDRTTGKRNQREEVVAELLCEVVGTTGALVVNNNAAMTTLVLAAIAPGREVVVSRGELVEIGGGFRMPDVMAQAGCKLVEVGTTNRTHLRDYERAIGPGTGLLLKVHPSNFRMLGFAETPEPDALAALARTRGIVAAFDLGSGLLWDGKIAGLEEEPRVRASVQSGMPLVCFSGDKLLGGPQCGILVGDKDLVARVRAHPLYRAFRCDKLKLAALEATLKIYRDGDAAAEIPTLRLLCEPAEALQARARALCDKIQAPPGGPARVVASESFAGSGSNPARPLPSFAVALPGGAPLAAALRTRCSVPVFARVADEQVLLDLRTLVLEDLDEVANRVRVALVSAVAP